MTQEERNATWAALLAAVSKLTEKQPGSFEYQQPGSGWWAAPHGSSRSPATYSDDGREIACTFKLWDADDAETVYHLSIRREGGAS